MILDRVGCLRVFVIAVAAGEIAVMIMLFDLALAEVVPTTRGGPVGRLKVIGLIFGCLAVPTAAAAGAYLANSTRGALLSLLAVIAHPIILITLLTLR